VEAGHLVGAELAHAPCRAAEHERAGRNARAGREQGPGADQALVLDGRSVEDDRPDADQAVIADRAAVEDGGMADGHAFADDGRPAPARHVHGRVVLDVRARPDAHPLDVAPHHGVEPEARFGPDGHVTDHHGGVDDEGRGVDRGDPVAERRDQRPGITERCGVCNGRHAPCPPTHRSNEEFS